MVAELSTRKDATEDGSYHCSFRKISWWTIFWLLGHCAPGDTAIILETVTRLQGVCVCVCVHVNRYGTSVMKPTRVRTVCHRRVLTRWVRLLMKYRGDLTLRARFYGYGM